MIDERDIERDYDEFDIDAELQQRLKGAYDSMTPSAEAQDRMLANILAAQADVAESHSDDAAATSPAPAAAASQVRTKNKRRRRPLYKIVVPAAAACAACAIAVGVLLNPGASQPDMMSGKGSESVSYESAAASSQDAASTAVSDQAVEPAFSEEAAAPATSNQSAAPSPQSDATANYAVTNEFETLENAADPSDVDSVKLHDGTTLELVYDPEAVSPTTVDKAQVGGLVESASAYSNDGQVIADCEVYRVLGQQGSYAILLDGQSDYYLAR